MLQLNALVPRHFQGKREGTKRDGRRRPLLGAFLFMAVFGLFGTPSAPLSDVLPTTGLALAGDCAYMMDCFPMPGDTDGDGIWDIIDPCPFDPNNNCNDFDNDLTPECDPNLSTAASVMSLGFALASVFQPWLMPISLGFAGASLATECEVW